MAAESYVVSFSPASPAQFYQLPFLRNILFPKYNYRNLNIHLYFQTHFVGLYSYIVDVVHSRWSCSCCGSCSSPPLQPPFSCSATRRPARYRLPARQWLWASSVGASSTWQACQTCCASRPPCSSTACCRLSCLPQVFLFHLLFTSSVKLS